MADAAAENALNFLLEFPDVDHVLILCGFANPVHRQKLVEQEGLDTMEAFGYIPDETIDRTARAWEARGRDRIPFGINRIIKLKAVAYWVRKSLREGSPVTIAVLTPAMVSAMIRERALEEAEGKRDEKLFYPPQFDPTKYIAWERSFENYLDSRRGRSKISLSYIIRPVDADPETATTEYEKAILGAPHTGPAFEEDNREVYRIYKDLMIGTDGWAWFNQAPVGNGRAAHRLIVNHYRGNPETARRAAQAEADIEKLVYYKENPPHMTFEKYVSRLTENFVLLEDNDQGLSETQKVKQFLKGIMSTHTDVMHIKSQTRANYPTDFHGAITFMAMQLSLIPGYMSQGDDHKRGAKRQVSALLAGMDQDAFQAFIASADRYAQLGRGRGRGGGNRHRGKLEIEYINGRQYRSGVDVTDPNRTFSPDEFARLKAGGHAAWLANIRWNNGGRPRGGGGGGRGANRGGRGHGRGHNAGRRVAFVESQQQDESGMAATNANANQRGGNAGARFGGRRYHGGR
jgi:hypothetical protein